MASSFNSLEEIKKKMRATERPVYKTEVTAYTEREGAENRLIYGIVTDTNAINKFTSDFECRKSFSNQEILWEIIHTRMHELFNPMHNIADIQRAEMQWKEIKRIGSERDGFNLIMQVIERVLNR